MRLEPVSFHTAATGEPANEPEFTVLPISANEILNFHPAVRIYCSPKLQDRLQMVSPAGDPSRKKLWQAPCMFSKGIKHENIGYIHEL